MKMLMFLALPLGLVAASAGLAREPDNRPAAPVVHGKLRPATHEPLPGWDTSTLPRWQLTVDGKTYYLEFHGNKEFDKQADKLQKCWYVKVTGPMEIREYGLSRSPRSDGRPVTDDGLLVKLPVIIVQAMEESELESAPTRVAFRGKLQWSGNRYFREENGLISGTCMACEWEGYELQTSKGKYRLLLEGDVAELYLRGWQGKSAVVVGRVETRVLLGWLRGKPYVAEVLIVEEIRVE